MAKGLNLTLPPIPADPSVIEIPKFSLRIDTPLLSRLPKETLHADNVLTMEHLDQNYGFVLYEKTFPSGLTGKLNLAGAKDYSIVMLDGQVIGEAFDGYGPRSYTIPVDHSAPCTLEILVHNLGRDSLLPEPAHPLKPKASTKTPPS